MEPRAIPPSNAVVLFGGQVMTDWQSRQGGMPRWKVEGGFLEVVPGTGDILTRATFRDAFLHLEFRCPDQPRARQNKANSGVFVQGRYELQILDSWGVKNPTVQDCGAIYGLAPPLVNASKPPNAWQTFEAIFRAPRERTDGDPEPARITVLHNGLVIHNNLTLPQPTQGALDTDLLTPGPLLLQDHGSPVAFRRIWMVPLAAGG